MNFSSFIFHNLNGAEDRSVEFILGMRNLQSILRQVELGNKALALAVQTDVIVSQIMDSIYNWAFKVLRILNDASINVIGQFELSLKQMELGTELLV